MIRFHHLPLLAAIFNAAAASEAAPSAAELAAIHRDPRAQAYYESRTNFFFFATPADLPADLKWDDGSAEKPFGDPAARPGGTMHLFVPSFPPTLRNIGQAANNSFRRYHFDDNSLDLVHLQPDTMKEIPALASSWAVSPDNTKAYYRLDPDARFRDGQPITADDYFFAVFFELSDFVMEPFKQNFYKDYVTGITRYDDYTIALHLPNPRPNPIYFGSIKPRPRNFYKELGADYTQRYQWRFEPTTGPYEIQPANVKQGQSVTLTKVADWWAKDKPFFQHRYNVDQIEFRVIRDEEKSFQIFLTGEIDIFGMSMFPKYWYDKADAAPFQKGYIEKVQFCNDIPRYPYGLYINRADPLLDDVNIRVGIHHASDWQRVINSYYRGDYERLQNFSMGFGRFSNPNVKAREYDPAKAREFFAKAGFDQVGRDGILRRADGVRLSFKLMMDVGEEQKTLATLVDSARRAGLELVPEVLDSTTSYKKMMQKNHQIAFSAWGVNGLYPTYWQHFHKDNAVTPEGTRKTDTNNITSTVDEGLSRMIDTFEKATTLDEIEKGSHAIIAALHDEASFVPAFYRPWIRTGAWRWVKFPEGFAKRLSETSIDFGLYWIDEDVKRETLEAMKAGRSFPPVLREYDQYRQD